jgi:hypothetical protein
MIMSVDNPTPGQHPGLVLAAMTLANAMVLVDQTFVDLGGDHAQLRRRIAEGAMGA